MLVKNDQYYAKDDIKFTKVQMTMVDDSGSELNMYETDQLDFLRSMPTGRIQTNRFRS